MTLFEVLPDFGEHVDPLSDPGRAWIKDRYRPPAQPWLRLNMVSTLTGSATGPDGTSESISNRIDRRVLGVIRSLADVVLVGAHTVRVEGYLAPKASHLAIVTSTGDLGEHAESLAEDTNGRVFLLTPAEHVDQVRSRAGAIPIIAVPAAQGSSSAPSVMSAQMILQTLSRRGYQSIVCEGGPNLAGQFAESGLIDEYCITVSPTLTPSTEAFLPLQQAISTRVAGHLVDREGFSYLRLQPQR